MLPPRADPWHPPPAVDCSRRSAIRRGRAARCGRARVYARATAGCGGAQHRLRLVRGAVHLPRRIMSEQAGKRIYRPRPGPGPHGRRDLLEGSCCRLRGRGAAGAMFCRIQRGRGCVGVRRGIERATSSAAPVTRTPSNTQNTSPADAPRCAKNTQLVRSPVARRNE